MEAEGTVKTEGALSYTVNPPVVDPAAGGIQFLGMSTTIRVDEGGVIAVRLAGRASYHDRTASYSIDVPANQELADAISNVIAEYGTQIHNATVTAAAEALGVAMRKGEI